MRLLSVLVVLGLVLAASAAVVADGDEKREKDREGGDDGEGRRDRDDKDGGEEADERDGDGRDEDDDRDADREREERKGNANEEDEARRGREGGGGRSDEAQATPSEPTLPRLPVAMTSAPGLLVVAIAAGPSQAVEASLPEVGSPWTVEAGDCELDGAALRCQGSAVAEARVAEPPAWAAEASVRIGADDTVTRAGLLLL